MLKVAFIYPRSNSYLWGYGDVMYYYNFFLKSLPKNKRINYAPMFVDSPVDVSHLSGFDVVIFWSCAERILKILGAEKLKCVKCCFGQDPPDMNEAWVQKYREYGLSFVFWLGMKKAYPRVCKLPSDICYESVWPGPDVCYYPKTDFKSRRKDKIVCMGTKGNQDTVLRGLMIESPQVEYVSKSAGYVGNKFNEMLKQYQAACTEATYTMVVKYVELPMGGCLTFMGANDTNGVEELGFVDGESCVYVTTENYRQKFDEYLDTVDDPRWERIAAAGKRHAEETWSSEPQMNKLIDLLERYV